MAKEQLSGLTINGRKKPANVSDIEWIGSVASGLLGEIQVDKDAIKLNSGENKNRREANRERIERVRPLMQTIHDAYEDAKKNKIDIVINGESQWTGWVKNMGGMTPRNAQYILAGGNKKRGETVSRVPKMVVGAVFSLSLFGDDEKQQDIRVKIDALPNGDGDIHRHNKGKLKGRRFAKIIVEIIEPVEEPKKDEQTAAPAKIKNLTLAETQAAIDDAIHDVHRKDNGSAQTWADILAVFEAAVVAHPEWKQRRVQRERSWLVDTLEERKKEQGEKKAPVVTNSPTVTKEELQQESKSKKTHRLMGGGTVTRCTKDPRKVIIAAENEVPTCLVCQRCDKYDFTGFYDNESADQSQIEERHTGQTAPAQQAVAQHASSKTGHPRCGKRKGGVNGLGITLGVTCEKCLHILEVEKNLEPKKEEPQQAVAPAKKARMTHAANSMGTAKCAPHLKTVAKEGEEPTCPRCRDIIAQIARIKQREQAAAQAETPAKKRGRKTHSAVRPGHSLRKGAVLAPEGVPPTCEICLQTIESDWSRVEYEKFLKTVPPGTSENRTKDLWLVQWQRLQGYDLDLTTMEATPIKDWKPTATIVLKPVCEDEELNKAKAAAYTPENFNFGLHEKVVPENEQKCGTCGAPWIDGKCGKGFINHKVSGATGSE